LITDTSWAGDRTAFRVSLYAPDARKLVEISSLKLADGTDAFSLNAAVDTDAR
jgi:hypothetical protein